jgi:predicted nucleotidyltransferase
MKRMYVDLLNIGANPRTNRQERAEKRKKIDEVLFPVYVRHTVPNWLSIASTVLVRDLHIGRFSEHAQWQRSFGLLAQQGV